MSLANILIGGRGKSQYQLKSKGLFTSLVPPLYTFLQHYGTTEMRLSAQNTSPNCAYQDINAAGKNRCQLPCPLIFAKYALKPSAFLGCERVNMTRKGGVRIGRKRVKGSFLIFLVFCRDNFKDDFDLLSPVRG